MNNDSNRNKTSAEVLDAANERIDDMLDHIGHALQDDGQDAVHGPLLSFVIPCKDEQGTLEALVAGITRHVPDRFDYEIILIDDGSQDDSWDSILQLHRNHPENVRGVRFRHNAGKATSLAAGFRIAKGDYVFTMDADLQDDPKEIGRFLTKMDEGFDLVSGWKRVRHDPWHKVWPSRIFNRFASALGGVRLHDHNCGFKCYRAAVVQAVQLHGELHRVVPALAHAHGFRVGEIEVEHHPRRAGISKYGIERILRGLSDVATTGFLRRFQHRPSHFFNGCAIGLVMAAVAVGVVGSALGAPVVLSGLIVALSLGGAMLCVVLGLTSELIVRGPIPSPRSLPIAEDTGPLAKDRRIASVTTEPKPLQEIPQPVETNLGRSAQDSLIPSHS